MTAPTPTEEEMGGLAHEATLPKEERNAILKDILDMLVGDCGEEYLKLHTGKQDFALTDARMNYSENAAIKKIVALFPATKIIRLPAVNHRNSEYDRGYNSGYIAGKRAQISDLGLKAEEPK